MKRETYEKQRAFAGELKPSMKRRCVAHDYSQRGMYMVTLATEGRKKLFGTLTGRSEGVPGAPDAPGIALTELGKEVERCWMAIPHYYPEVKVIALQIMPDHIHGILFVTRRMEGKDLGDVIKGFKVGCNKAMRRLEGDEYEVGLSADLENIGSEVCSGLVGTALSRNPQIGYLIGDVAG
jgi:REP element-mobilizing transposase RayT